MYKKAILLILSISLIFFACGKKEEGLRISFLDVQKGDSILIEIPKGENILVDCGIGEIEEFSYDAGKVKIYPYLKRRGIKELNLVFISHLHYDHFGGVFHLLDNLKIKKIIFNPPQREIFRYQELLSKIKEKKIEFSSIFRGDDLKIGDLKIEVLNPPKENRFKDENNNSIVLILSYNKVRILLCGDIEEEAISQLMEKYPEKISAEIIKIPHHGRRIENILKFMEMVDPKIAIITRAPGNNKVDKRLIDYCRKNEIKIYSNTTHGDIRLNISKEEIRIKTKRWVLW